jgi:hypothetical protein
VGSWRRWATRPHGPLALHLCYPSYYLAHHKACLVKVIRVFILDAVLSFNVSYQAKPALNNLRILAERSLVIILAIKLHYKLIAALNPRTRPV